MRQLIRAMWLVVVCVALGACAVRHDVVIGGDVADVRRFPQDLAVYAGRTGADTLLLTPAVQSAQWERYQRLLYGPWRGAGVTVSKADAFAPLAGTGYGENLLPRRAEDVAALVANSNQAAYPSRLEAGVTVRATALRAAPTALPRFNNPLRAGEGFPFDLWQYATLPPGMPVLVTHASSDGAWLFVENALVGGWLAGQDVALVDAAFIAGYGGRLAAVTHEGAVVRDGAGRTLFVAGIGTLLPRGAGPGEVLAPARDAQGKAVLVRGRMDAAMLADAPLPLTPGRMADIGNRLMGEPYGWGGLYGRRDCSAMLRDMFTPFGVWLPRNSAAQAKAWSFDSLEGLAATARETAIIKGGKPFASLLWLPGHIGLYLGEYDGSAVMFHDVWGVRTQYGDQEGRYVLGRALVSSLRPGAELPGVPRENLLIARIRGMSTLR